MAIARWDPFDMFVSAQDDLNRLFKRNWMQPQGADSMLPEGARWAPAVDIYESEGQLVVEAELPGVTTDDIDVSIDEDTLVIRGERKVEREVREENYYRVERAIGDFQRSIRLPSEVDSEKVKASYEDGVLKVTVPKMAPRKARRIAIDKGKKSIDKGKEKG
jgi:HSP20 family protein